MANSPKRVNAKEVVTDIRQGMDDSALAQKYGLQPHQIGRLFQKLVDRHFLTETEVRDRQTRPQDGEKKPSSVSVDSAESGTSESRLDQSPVDLAKGESEAALMTKEAPVRRYRDYKSVPWYRKSRFNSGLLVAALLLFWFNPIVGGPFIGVPLILWCCVNVRIGGVYYNEYDQDGYLKKWGRGNEIVAGVLLLLAALYIILLAIVVLIVPRP